MKLILSRKGLDSTSGGFPSPILPDGRLCWIPIPGGSAGDPRYEDISLGSFNIATMISDLSKGRVRSNRYCHLDPDMNSAHLKRPKNWRGAFGQCAVAQGHLDGNGVDIGDLFLFFGWFRRAEMKNEKWGFVKDAPHLHVLWGWMQVGAKYHVKTEKDKIPSFAETHTHVLNSQRYRGIDANNTLYVASDKLNIADVRGTAPGWGVFSRFREPLQLTSAKAKSRADWLLPEFFFPSKGKEPLSYHGDLKRWQKVKNGAKVKSVGRGQEFIIDCGQYPESKEWAARIIREGTK